MQRRERRVRQLVLVVEGSMIVAAIFREWAAVLTLTCVLIGLLIALKKGVLE